MLTVVNLRDHAVTFTPWELHGNRVLTSSDVDVEAGGTVDVSDECANGAPEYGMGGLLEQEENWAVAKKSKGKTVEGGAQVDITVGEGDAEATDGGA